MVTLAKPCRNGYARIRVGISVYPTFSKIGPHFSLVGSEASVVLRPNIDCLVRYKSTDELYLACQLAVVNAVEHLRCYYQKPFDYKFGVLEGDDLPGDCTVGFAVAAFLAAVRATGFARAVEMDLHDWKEEH